MEEEVVLEDGLGKENKTMIHYVKDKFGHTHTIEEYGWDNGKVTLCIDNSNVINVKMYYTECKTWDQYMGNKPCGYYALVPIPNFKNRKRIYLELHR